MKPFRYSTIQDFYKCPAYYKHKNIDGLSDGGEKSGDMAFGTAVHLGVQDLFEGGDGLDVFSTLWGLNETKDLEYGRLDHEALATLGTQLLSIFAEEHMKHFVPQALEKKLTTKLGEHTYSGTVDFIGTYRGVPSVVDWKTSAMPYDQYKIKVNEQLYGYAFLAERELSFRAEQIVYGVAVKDPKNPRWQFKKEALLAPTQQKALDNIHALCNTISTTEVFTRNPQACVGYKKVCPFFSKCFGGNSGGGEEG